VRPLLRRGDGTSFRGGDCSIKTCGTRGKRDDRQDGPQGGSPPRGWLPSMSPMAGVSAMVGPKTLPVPSASEAPDQHACHEQDSQARQAQHPQGIPHRVVRSDDQRRGCRNKHTCPRHANDVEQEGVESPHDLLSRIARSQIPPVPRTQRGRTRSEKTPGCDTAAPQRRHRKVKMTAHSGRTGPCKLLAYRGF
jgi:hypothetical protein